MAIEDSQPWPLVESADWPDGLYPVSEHARVTVGAAGGRRVRVTGIGRLFRAHEIHVENSIGVVAGDQCRLTAEDHVHVYRATIDFGALLDPPKRLEEAVQAVVKDPDNARTIARLAAELRRSCPAVERPDPGVEERRVGRWCSISVAESVGVQLGSGNNLNIHHKYIAEQLEVPIGELLTDETVLRQLAHVMAAPDDPGAIADLLRTATRALWLVDDTVLAALSESRPMSDAILHSFFGRAEIANAEPVMIGVGNELERTTTFHLPGLRRRDFASALGGVLVHVPPPAGPEQLKEEPERTPAPSVGDETELTERPEEKPDRIESPDDERTRDTSPDNELGLAEPLEDEVDTAPEKSLDDELELPEPLEDELDTAPDKPPDDELELAESLEDELDVGPGKSPEDLEPDRPGFFDFW